MAAVNLLTIQMQLQGEETGQRKMERLQDADICAAWLFAE